MFAKVAFYPSLLYGVILEKLGLRQWYTRINDTIILGALPFKSMAKELVDMEHVRGLVTLNEEFELQRFVFTKEEWKKLGVNQLWLPTRDFTGAPSQDDLNRAIRFIEEHKDQQETVYVHCKAGRTRSATVVAAYLMQENGWGPEEAFSLIKQRRPHVILLKQQWKALKEFQKKQLPDR